MDQQPAGKRPRLAWVSPLTPWKLDSVTWLATTQQLRQQGLDVTLLAAGPPGPATYQGVEVFNIERPETYFVGRMLFHLRLLRYLLPRLAQFDCILFHPISAMWLFPLRLLGRRCPLLVMDSRDLLDFNTRTLKARLRNKWERFTYWLAQYFAHGQTAITPRLAQLVGIAPEQLWGIWPSGVDPEAFAVSREGRHWPAADEPIQLVYVGVFLEQRNLLALARAVRRANDEGMKFVLSLFGDGPYRPALEAYASEGNDVVVERPIPYEQIPAMLNQAHIGVTSLPPSHDRKYEASSPLKLFEYMAAGLPVLSTRNLCHTDVVQDGRYAFWADEPSEEALLAALRRAWAVRDHLDELGREAYRGVHEWTWAASARKLFKALEEGRQRASAGAAVATPVASRAPH
jgi:glycosyltransferase involved in cell wall biosynthesis